MLGYLIAELLFRVRDADSEDTMTLMRASLVKGETLAQIAEDIGLGEYIKLGLGERKSGGRKRASILADALEAVVAAIHQDGGIEPARRLIEKLFVQRLRETDPESIKDPKTRLQELLQGQGLARPEYEVVGTSGSEHRRRFTVRCLVPEFDLSAEAEGSSRRGAEKAAALVLLDKVRDRGG